MSSWTMNELIKWIKFWLDSVGNRHLPKAKRSFVPLPNAFSACVFEKTRKTTFKQEIMQYFRTYLQLVYWHK